MYTQFFKLKQEPFSIAPDPRYLLLTHGHREALAHLMYGVNSGGGIVLLTGEIGAGKTTVCRCFLEQVPANCNVAYIFNPKLTVDELLQSICEEFRITRKPENASTASIKDYVDALTDHLLSAHARGRNNVLIIDEAQNLSADVLEQLRLLTNLETNERKLLQIILIGQPELRTMLEREELKQLAQRVIARFHLVGLSQRDTASYIAHRLAIAGLTHEQPFSQGLAKQIYRITQGVPRRINLLCDRAMLGAYSEGTRIIDRKIIDKAAEEVFGAVHTKDSARWPHALVFGSLVCIALGSALAWTAIQRKPPLPSATPAVAIPRANIEQTKSIPISRPKTTSDAAPAAKANEAALASLRGINDAYQSLGKAWGLTEIAGDFCTAVVQQGLHCLKEHKGLPELNRLDRPAVLVMRDPENQPYYLVLTALNDTVATLRDGDTQYKVSAEVIRRQFPGEFITLQREPRPYRGELKPGDRGVEVDWVAAQLAMLNGQKAPETGKPFDDNLTQQVREFQRDRGLTVDGFIGPLTFVHLKDAMEAKEPRLHTETPTAAITAIPD